MPTRNQLWLPVHLWNSCYLLARFSVYVSNLFGLKKTDNLYEFKYLYPIQTFSKFPKQPFLLDCCQTWENWQPLLSQLPSLPNFQICLKHRALMDVRWSACHTIWEPDACVAACLPVLLPDACCTVYSRLLLTSQLFYYKTIGILLWFIVFVIHYLSISELYLLFKINMSYQ